MRAVLLLVVVVVGVAGCPTARNPNACCTNAAECADVGFDEITPCLGVKVCIDGTCEDPTCTTSADCTDPASPYCVGTTCVATCSGDETCPDEAAPYCADDGVCVGCLDNSHCPAADAAVCDDGSRTCRGCMDDGECASGICLASEGTCATADEVIFVAGDGTDSGDCDESAPCATVAYALMKLTSTRRVVRLVSSDYVSPDGIVIDRDVYFDGAGTRVGRTSAGPAITFQNQARAVLENVRLARELLVRGGADVTAYRVEGAAQVGEDLDIPSTLRFIRGRVSDGGSLQCQASNLEVSDSEFVNSHLDVTFCGLTAARNRFQAIEASPAIISHEYADTLIENNVIEADRAHQGQFMVLTTNIARPAGGVVRFNTMINTSSTAGAGMISLVSAAAEINFSGNLVIANSPGVIGSASSNFSVEHSLFDDATGALSGEGNLVADVDDIFVDFAGGDFRPAASSPARGAGDPAQDPGEDFDGNPRPRPAGSPPDIGAFEVE